MKAKLFFCLAAVSLLALPVAAQVANYRDLRYPTLPEFKIPKPTVFTLKNGMKVFLLEDHELPLVRVSARIRTGSNYEPAEKAGLARLVGTVQRSGGTLRQNGDQIDDFLAARAAHIETGIGSDSGFAGMDCLKQDFDDVFKVFAEILRTPAFSQDKLDVAKVTENTMIARRNDSIGAIVSREITRLVYGPDSPLARNTEYATIKAITRDDLVAWHKQFYHPNNIFLGICGDFDSAAIREKIEATFGDWPQGPAFSTPPVAYREKPVPGYYFIEKSDVNQANIAFGHLGIEIRNPDYFAAQVMNEILGGGFSSRMFSNVRSRKGLAYNVYGSLGASFFQPGLFRAGLQTKSANLTAAIQAVRDEITGIIETPPAEAELKRAKDSILNSFIFNYDSREKILSQQMTYAFYGLPDDFLEQYRANIEKVTIADVSRVAKKYVHPDQLAILVVGKSAEFDKPLSSLGQVTTIDITIPPPADSTPKAEKNAASVEGGKQAWAKVVKFMGGEALKKTEAVRVTANVTAHIGGQSVVFKQIALVAYPDRMRLAFTTAMGDQTIVLDGEGSFISTAGQIEPLPAAARDEHLRELVRDPGYLLRYHDDPGIEVLAAGEEPIDGIPCQILAASFKGTQSRLWVAPDGKIVKHSYQGKHPVTRAPGLVENLLSNYRAEGPLQMAHRVSRRIDGQEVLTATLESIEINPKLDPDTFKKPAR